MHLLDNVIWHALSGHQAKFATGGNTARRYAAGFSPILGFADPQAPDLAALRPHCGPEEHFYCAEWNGAVPADWQVEVESSMFRMAWAGATPSLDEAPDALPLGPQHAQAALALALLTKPGPFGLRTLELGDYFGYFEGGQLIAMAGERMHAGAYREISGVCTHPDFQGRGLARRLMRKLLLRQLQRGERPFLHVMQENAGARSLYERMGFAVYREVAVRVVSLRDAP